MLLQTVIVVCGKFYMVLTASSGSISQKFIKN